MKRTLQDRALIGFGIHYWYDEQVRQFSAITMADRDPARPAFGYDWQRVCSRATCVSIGELAGGKTGGKRGHSGLPGIFLKEPAP